MADITNPVGTREQREEIRRCGFYSPAQIDAALDGLDIAQEREEHMASERVHGDYCPGCLDLKRRWDTWKGKR